MVSVAWLLPRRVGAIAAVLALVFALTTLAEYVIGRNLGIDQALFDDPSHTAHPGRSSLVTVVCLAVLALSRMFAHRGRGVPCQAAGMVALMIGAAALLGYLYDVRELYSARPVTAVALQTAIGAALLGVAALASVDGGVFTWAVRGSDAGALLLRRHDAARARRAAAVGVRLPGGA